MCDDVKSCQGKKKKKMNLYADIDVKLPDDVLALIEERGANEENLIVVLHKVQDHYGYIPQDEAAKVAQLLNVSLAKVYGVMTFYHLFKLKKPGKHKIQVCMGTACYLKGAKDLIMEFEKLLAVTVGNTTDDGEFTLETVRCVGCCGLAPVVVIDEDVYGNLKKDDLPEILSKYVTKKMEDVCRHFNQ